MNNMNAGIVPSARGLGDFHSTGNATPQERIFR